MRFRFIVFLGALMLVGSSCDVLAQQVQILYTKAGLNKALSYKKLLKVDRMDTFFAFGLYNISQERESAYIKTIFSNDAVIILGESALKASSQVDFPMAVIIVNAVGKTSARGPIFRVIESDFPEGRSLQNLRSVSNARTFTLVAADLVNRKETRLRCRTSCGDLVNKLVSEIARGR